MKLTKKEKDWLFNMLFNYECRFELNDFGELIDNDISIQDDKIKRSILNKLKETIR